MFPAANALRIAACGALIALAGAFAGTAGSEAVHWAYRPIVRAEVPQLPGAAPMNPVDAFLRAALVQRGLTPLSPADRRTLLRRVTFDLTGLAPTPAELEAFDRDSVPGAYERVVDRLLASPRFGERWARHWIDTVHFAETHGHDQDRIRTNAWPYRDYLVAAFNQDRPYARFIQEQVAGDVLFPEAPDATVALGFLAAGPWDESSLRDIRDDTLDRQIARYVDRDDMIATVMATVTSSSVHCARCHDHKLDPISQRDYYSLQAVFSGVDRANRVFDDDPVIHRKRLGWMADRRALERGDEAWLSGMVRRPEFADALSAFDETVGRVRGVRAGAGGWNAELSAQDLGVEEAFNRMPVGLAGVLITPRAQRTAVQQERLERWFARPWIDRCLSSLPPPRMVYAAASDFLPDASLVPSRMPRPVNLLHRGEITQPRERCFPGALSCLPQLPSRFELGEAVEEGPRRAALARWLTEPAHPLTWRSIVNRVWQWHFGRGLVETANDFGRMGAAPTHPELLDWLAAWFREDAGGSLKQLHRLLVTSEAYRRAVAPAVADFEPGPAAAAANRRTDADNRFLWRMNRTRLDAECVRDAVLQAADVLDLRAGGPSDQQFDLKPGIHVTPRVDYAKFDPQSSLGRRRSIYRFLFRTLPDPMMDALDCPAGDQLTPARQNSVTVQQALALWNSAFIAHQSGNFARRLEGEEPDPARRLRLACLWAWGREPTGTEAAELGHFARRHGWTGLARLFFNSNEFVFIN